jgi:hypothetical protein
LLHCRLVSLFHSFILLPSFPSPLSLTFLWALFQSRIYPSAADDSHRIGYFPAFLPSLPLPLLYPALRSLLLLHPPLLRLPLPSPSRVPDPLRLFVASVCIYPVPIHHTITFTRSPQSHHSQFMYTDPVISLFHLSYPYPGTARRDAVRVFLSIVLLASTAALCLDICRRQRVRILVEGTHQLDVAVDPGTARPLPPTPAPTAPAPAPAPATLHYPACADTLQLQLLRRQRHGRRLR